MKVNEERIFLMIFLLDRLFSEDITEARMFAESFPTDMLEELWNLRTDLHDSLTFTQSP
jgi:hypothetical protein